MWKGKDGLDTLQVSTMAVLRTRLLRRPMMMATATAHDSIIWHTKMGTHAHKWQGGTNEECCIPKYSSQHTTSTSTQWKRKPQQNAQASTDVECYEQLWCSDYCCVGAGWMKKPEAGTRPASTDAECCTPRSEAEDLPDLHTKKVRSTASC